MQFKSQARYLGARLFRDALDAGNAVVDLGRTGRLPGEDEEDDGGQDFEKAQGQEHDCGESRDASQRDVEEGSGYPYCTATPARRTVW